LLAAREKEEARGGGRDSHHHQRRAVTADWYRGVIASTTARPGAADVDSSTRRGCVSVQQGASSAARPARGGGAAAGDSQNVETSCAAEVSAGRRTDARVKELQAAAPPTRSSLSGDVQRLGERRPARWQAAEATARRRGRGSEQLPPRSEKRGAPPDSRDVTRRARREERRQRCSITELAQARGRLRRSTLIRPRSRSAGAVPSTSIPLDLASSARNGHGVPRGRAPRPHASPGCGATGVGGTERDGQLNADEAETLETLHTLPARGRPGAKRRRRPEQRSIAQEVNGPRQLNDGLSGRQRAWTRGVASRTSRS
jgi:hypothetical protein